MSTTSSGSFRLFRVAGIDVFLHWSWLVVAFIELQNRNDVYSKPVWNVIEYLSLFGIILLHEFGHAFACRQVGGSAEQIVLWPLGGVAYVKPPRRPGAVLWSIAAGPLVNLLLVPITIGLVNLSGSLGWNVSFRDLHIYLYMMAWINGILLIFNLLPIYPLDGGQIVQSLLWFVIGQARSLMVVTVLGMTCGVAAIGWIFSEGNPLQGKVATWRLILAAFVIYRSWLGFQYSRGLLALARLPRHEDLACPNCKQAPLKGALWTCELCGTRFDAFQNRGQCQQCGKLYADMECLECHKQFPYQDWQKPAKV